MDNVLPLSVALIPLAPLVAGLIVLVATVHGYHWSTTSRLTAFGCGVSCAASIVALWELLRGPGGTEHSWEWVHWLSVAGPFPIDVSLGLRIDELSALLIAAITLTACVGTIVSAKRTRGADTSHLSPLVGPFVIFGGTMLLLAPNVLQLVFFWQATSFVVFAAAADQQESSQSAAASRKALLISRLGDAPLLFGLLLLWYHFGSPNWLEMLAIQAAGTGDPEKSHLLSAVGICLLGGVAARCAQFPLLGWLEDFAAAARPTILFWEAIVLMPTGVYLIARFAGVFPHSMSLQLATLAIGGFTALLAAMSAATAPDARRTIAYSAASLCGWILVGIATADVRGVDGATRLLLISIVSFGVILCGADRVFADRGGAGVSPPTSRIGWLMALGALPIVSGCWGQSAILAALWDSVGSSSGSADGFTLLDLERKGLLLVLLCIDTLALLLLAFGLFRAIFTMRLEQDASASDLRTNGPGGSFLPAMLVLIGSAVLLLPLGLPGTNVVQEVMQRTWPAPGDTSTVDLLSFCFALPPALIGVVGAWMRFGSGAEPRAGDGGLFRPLVRWSRSRYFLDDFFFLFLELPIRGLAQLCRFFDWFLIDGLFVQIPARFPDDVMRLARPLQQGTAQLYALGTFLATAVLLAVVLWIRG